MLNVSFTPQYDLYTKSGLKIALRCEIDRNQHCMVTIPTLSISINTIPCMKHSP